MPSAKYRLCLGAVTSLPQPDLDALEQSIERFRQQGMSDRQSEVAALDEMLAQIAASRASVFELLGRAPTAPQTESEQTPIDELDPKTAGAVRLGIVVQRMLRRGETLTWQGLFRQADEAFSGTQAQGAYTVKDAYDAMEMGVNRYILERGSFYSPNATADSAQLTIVSLKHLLDRLPTQTKRTAEQDQFQQFSTPPAFAYAANWVANVQPGEIYLEPSAGLGGIAVFGQNAGAKVVLNELAPRRADMLEQVMPGARVFREDAEQIHNILPDDIKPTVVVMNPPFSSSGTRGVKDRNIGAAHIKQALARLAPGGRLVAIVGAGMSIDAPGYAGFWRDMKAQFYVRAAIPVEGTEYAKYGTTFGNVLLVIDKVAPQGKDVVVERADTYNDLIRLLAGVRDDRPAAKPAPDRRPTERPAPVPAGGEPVRASQATPRARPAPVEPGAVGAGEQPSARDVGRSGGGSTVDGDGRPAGPVLEPAEPGVGTGDLFADGSESGPVETGGSGTGGQPSPVTPDEPAAELTDSVFEAYRPQRLDVPGAKPHPGALVQSAAMASVQPPAATYKPNLPKTSITKGDISIAQLEAVVYAGQAHQQFAADGTRLGFFIGDGTGVGKGREIGAIILDNLRQGRKKAVWITEKQGLIKDARRDYAGVGGDPSILFNQNKAKADEAIEQGSGVIFTTYSTLRSAAVAQKVEGEDKPRAAPTRLEQLVKWLGPDFDGVIAFDEAHNAGNAVPIKGDRGVSEPSAQAVAVVELQKQMPKARVVYVSATGATEVSNLSFANRLGLWGEGTPFESVEKFINQMVAGGLATMELVARDMKQMGAYLARSLSFDDVTYGRVDHKLTPLQRDIYDRLAEGWQVTLQNMQKALEVTGAVSDKGKTLNKAAKRNAKSAYWGAQQRFFNQIITSMQMPTVVEQIKADLKAKRAVVLQLVNTNEAQQERSLAKRRNDDEEQTDLEDLDLTPRDQLMQMVQKAFPVVQYEKKIDENGRAYSEPVKDSQGNLVENKEAVAMRDALLADLEKIRVPDGPLEILLNEFGPDAVAEITGRKQRVVRRKQDDGTTKMVLESRGGAAAAADADAFMADKKQILVFSDAGGTGYSFQADLGKKNQRKRAHYLLQPGWRANKAVQGLGRTHRTNQKSAPEYRLVSTDVPAHKRFLSSIARRLDQLGALTKGQRDTSSGGLFSEKDNLESKYATAAVKQLIDDAKRGQVPDVDFVEFLRQMGLEDIVDKDTGQIAEAKYPPTRQFLNRLLSLTLDMQERIFQAFIDRMEANVETAARMGTLDTGLQTIRAMATKVMRRQTVHVDKRTKAETEYVELELTQPTRIYPFPKPYKGEKAEYVVNKKSGRVWFKLASGSITRSNGAVETRYLMRGTNGHVYKGEREFDGDRYETIDEDKARQMWDDETAKRPATYTERAHMLVGALLPIWDRLNTTQTMQVVRVQTDTGERLLGRQVMEHELAETMARLEVATEESEMAPADVMARILGGDVAELANGWRLGAARVAGQQRIEISMGRSTSAGPELVRRGAIEERIGWEYRYFVPTNERGQDLLAYIFETKPIVVLGRVDDDGKVVRRSNVQGGRTLVNPDRQASNRPVIDQQLPEMKSAKSAARWLAKNASEPWMREVAGKILEGIDEDAEIQYLEVGKNYRLPKPVAEVMRAGTFGVSEIDTVTGKNRLYMKWAPDRPIAQEDMLHELLHAATQRALSSPKSAAVRQELQTIQRALLANLRSLAASKSTSLSQEGRDAAEFFSKVIINEDELLAYGLTSPTFREWATRMTKDGWFEGPREAYARDSAERMFERATPEPELTLWERFVDVVRSLLGLSKLYAPRLAAMLKQRERERIAFVTQNSNQTLAQRLDELLREVVQAQRRTSREEYIASWAPRAGDETIDGEVDDGGHDADTTARVLAGTAEIRAGIRGFSQQGARNLLLDLMGEAGGIGAWAKTVGTQYAKARQNPGTFGRVFEAVQDYIKDINVFANTAADRAPSILPKLEHWTDLKKRGAAPADMKAAGAAIWKGTLEDKRVYKADELRKMGLNGTQIELYKEFRAAVDQSLDDLARTEIMRLAGNDGIPVGSAVMGSRSLREAATVMIEHLSALHAKTLRRDLLLAIEQINDKAVKVEKLKDEGYAPLMRFGRHTLHITDKEGRTLFFGMYESSFEANRARRELEADPEFKGANFTRGKASQEAYRLFSGMPLDALELFAEATGNEDNAIYQEYLKLTKSNRSALKRMIHRQGIAGFNEDATRVLASFVTSNARMASGNMNLGRAKSAANAIPKELGDLKDEATKLVLYVQDPQEEASAIRGLLFTNFIGGSVASAAVNLTQPFTMSLPYLSQFGGVASAGRHLLAALRQVNSPQGEIAEALKRAEDDGVVSPQEIHHLRAEAMSRLGNHPFLKKAAFIWGSMFSLSEQFNRRLTFIAAYNTAKQNRVEDPFAFAERAVIETQGLYNKGNKPNWARGAIGATVFTFKQYSIHYLEFLRRMWQSGPEGKRAVGVAIAILMLTAGASGLPFADDLDDAVDTLAQALGYDFSSKKAKRAFIAETLGLGQLAGEVAMRGLSAIPGFPIDVSLRMGMGNLLPGTGALLRSNTDRAKDVLEFAGAAGSLARSVMDSGNKMLSGAPVDAALGVAPIAIQNIAKAMQMWNTGEYRNTRGQKVMNADAVDAVMKGIGFQPAQIARESAAMGEVQRSVQLAKNVEGQIAEKWAQGLNDGDQAKVADARADLRAWNEKNDSQMKISMQQIIQRVRELRSTRAERTIRSAPPEMRGDVRRAFAGQP